MEIDVPDTADWNALSGDIWMRVMRCNDATIDAFNMRDVAKCMCINTTFLQAGNKMLSSIEVFNRGSTRERRIAKELTWLFEKFSNLRCLKSITMGNFGSFQRPLARCMQLTKMDLNGLKISCDDLRRLFYNSQSQWPNFPNLRSLTLKNLRFLGRENEKWLRPFAIPYLTSLSITWCTGLTTDMVQDIAFKLHYLSLHGCLMVSDPIASRLHNIEELDLAFTQLTDKGLDTLHYGCPALRHLTLAQRHNNNWDSGLYTEEGLGKFKELRPNVEVKLVNC